MGEIQVPSESAVHFTMGLDIFERAVESANANSRSAGPHARLRSMFDCNICKQSKVVPPAEFDNSAKKTWFLKGSRGTEIKSLKGKEPWQCLACSAITYQPVQELLSVTITDGRTVARFEADGDTVVFVVNHPRSLAERSYCCEARAVIYFL